MRKFCVGRCRWKNLATSVPAFFLVSGNPFPETACHGPLRQTTIRANRRRSAPSEKRCGSQVHARRAASAATGTRFTIPVMPSEHSRAIAAEQDRRTRCCFGKRVSRNNGNYQYLGAQGYYTDSGTGLIKLGARYYDPTTGRFNTRIQQGAGRIGKCTRVITQLMRSIQAGLRCFGAPR